MRNSPYPASAADHAGTLTGSATTMPSPECWMSSGVGSEVTNQSIWLLFSAALSAAGLGRETHFSLVGSTPCAFRKRPASALVLAELAPPVELASAWATWAAGEAAVSPWSLANFVLTTSPSGFP